MSSLRKLPPMPVYQCTVSPSKPQASSRMRPRATRWSASTKTRHVVQRRPMTPRQHWTLYVSVVAPRVNARQWRDRRFTPDRYIGDVEQIGDSAKAYKFALDRDLTTYDVSAAYKWCLRKIGIGSGKGSWEHYAEDAAHDGYVRWVKAGGKVNPKICVRSALLNLVRREGISQKMFTPLELGTVGKMERPDNGPGFQISQLPESLQYVACQIAEGRSSEQIRQDMKVGKETVNRMRRQITEALTELLKRGE